MEWGGKKDPEKVPMTKLPFFCCSLSLTPFKNPVCSPDGIVFDLISIIPYIKKYKKNPVTGQDLKTQDLIKLTFHKNEKEEYHDPISFKTFTEYTHIVAIKISGNVYAMDTVEELNRKPKFWKDLVSGEPFQPKDIITLQDPQNIQNRTISNFDYIKNNISVNIVEADNSYINKDESTKIVMKKFEEHNNKEEEEKQKKDQEELEKIEKKIKLEKEILIKNQQISVEQYLEMCDRNQEFQHKHQSNNQVAMSVTSTATQLSKNQNIIEYRGLTKEEIRNIIHNQVKNKQMKGYATMITNLGTLQIVIHANFVPLTSENFLELAENGYYNGTRFHRLIKDFMVQGGDPTGTGTGGQSIFGGKFEDEFHHKIKHNKPGILSMANSGPNQNGSQFFITLGQCYWLDEKHNAFGEIIGDQLALHKINKSDIQNDNRPKNKIFIDKIIVTQNPFRIIIQQMMKEKQDKIKEQQRIESEKSREHERWIKDEDKFTMPQDLLQQVNDDQDQNNQQNIQKAGLFQQITDPSQQFYDYVPKEKHRKQFNFQSW
ncbi:peptidyl-prolyl cis-trans isomerase, putative [Ichthyophthirius multifiliis]|uniref:Peptidyl-prolyl cis-trans isomerase, putative n=1 Tax=Ichthyophthirius multifiliis TaxID=5932 RepID=G0QNQ5_ICHMU|nr:peptidyl-prolyl cis-trans isomerase, putative [Ichthyophthirius multifiliis]EGR33135.1 peptidyl-prolyl cis-trans isomerase, putative [Ichthyophthirius multifiliis]|eukprot:XP_004037121.1 peptidyl-prolyl cis-trans isomerase, putative [Ichthyophthirius multifiliis]